MVNGNRSLKTVPLVISSGMELSLHFFALQSYNSYTNSKHFSISLNWLLCAQGIIW